MYSSTCDAECTGLGRCVYVRNNKKRYRKILSFFPLHFLLAQKMTKTPYGLAQWQVRLLGMTAGTYITTIQAGTTQKVRDQVISAKARMKNKCTRQTPQAQAVYNLTACEQVRV